MSNEVKFTWRKDVNKEDKQQLALPAYFCRECGDSGWIAYKTKKSNSLDKDPGKTAIQFINNNENCWLLNLCKDDNKPIEEYQGITESWWIDPADLHVYDQQGVCDVVGNAGAHDAPVEFHMGSCRDQCRIRLLGKTGKREVGHGDDLGFFLPGDLDEFQDDRGLTGS